MTERAQKIKGRKYCCQKTGEIFIATSRCAIVRTVGDITISILSVDIYSLGGKHVPPPRYRIDESQREILTLPLVGIIFSSEICPQWCHYSASDVCILINKK